MLRKYFCDTINVNVRDEVPSRCLGFFPLLALLTKLGRRYDCNERSHNYIYLSLLVNQQIDKSGRRLTFYTLPSFYRPYTQLLFLYTTACARDYKSGSGQCRRPFQKGLWALLYTLCSLTVRKIQIFGFCQSYQTCQSYTFHNLFVLIYLYSFLYMVFPFYKK